MNDFKIKNKPDLRIYTNFSVGSDSVETILHKVLTSDITVFSITDINTVEGCIKMQSYLREDDEVKFIPGVEIPCRIRFSADFVYCHILGYHINPQNPHLQSFLNKVRANGYAQAEEAIYYIMASGGIAFLSQPETLQPNLEKHLITLSCAGLAGIECYNPGYSYKVIDQYMEIANQFGLLISGGSGYKGDKDEDKVQIGTLCSEPMMQYPAFSQILGYNPGSGLRHMIPSRAAARQTLSKFLNTVHQVSEQTNHPVYYTEMLKEMILMAGQEMARKENPELQAVWEKNLIQNYKKNHQVNTKLQMSVRYLKPDTIYQALDNRIAGQEKAKKMLSRICYEHLIRIIHPEMHLRKNNYIMFGPTGCGKTELARVLQEILPVPVDIVDASSITKNGYSGADKEDVMFVSKNRFPDIEHGIIFLDEFDKLCMPNTSTNGDTNRVIQSELLKMIEGTVLQRHIKKGSLYDTETLDTQNITFICTGTFDGAFESQWSSGLGFGREKENLTANKLITDCLIDYGMIPELAGRISSAIPLKNLTEKDLYEIMTVKENNCYMHLHKLFETAYGVKMILEDDTIHYLCQLAVERKLGARGLSVMVENVFRDALDHINPDKDYLWITRQMAEESILGTEEEKEEYSRSYLTQM